MSAPVTAGVNSTKKITRVIRFKRIVTMTFAQINLKRSSFPPPFLVRVLLVGHLAGTCQTVFNFLESNRKRGKTLNSVKWPRGSFAAWVGGFSVWVWGFVVLVLFGFFVLSFSAHQSASNVNKTSPCLRGCFSKCAHLATPGQEPQLPYLWAVQPHKPWLSRLSSPALGWPVQGWREMSSLSSDAFLLSKAQGGLSALGREREAALAAHLRASLVGSAPAL